MSTEERTETTTETVPKPGQSIRAEYGTYRIKYDPEWGPWTKRSGICIASMVGPTGSRYPPPEVTPRAAGERREARAAEPREEEGDEMTEKRTGTPKDGDIATLAEISPTRFLMDADGRAISARQWITDTGGDPLPHIVWVRNDGWTLAGMWTAQGVDTGIVARNMWRKEWIGAWHEEGGIYHYRANEGELADWDQPVDWEVAKEAINEPQPLRDRDDHDRTYTIDDYPEGRDPAEIAAATQSSREPYCGNVGGI